MSGRYRQSARFHPGCATPTYAVCGHEEVVMSETNGESAPVQISHETRQIKAGENRGVDSFIVAPAEPATGPIESVLAPPPAEPGGSAPQANAGEGTS